MIRAKMYCQSTKADGDNEVVHLHAVVDEANKSWAKWTPSGSAILTINNEDAKGKFEAGKTYFVDFTPAPATEAGEAKASGKA